MMLLEDSLMNGAVPRRRGASKQIIWLETRNFNNQRCGSSNPGRIVQNWLSENDCQVQTSSRWHSCDKNVQSNLDS